MSLSPDQERVFKRIDEAVLAPPQRLAVLGGAGVGKSFLIEALQEKYPMITCAPTGIAAYNVRGGTLHSFLGMSPSSRFPDKGRVKQHIKKMQPKLIVVDEISMISRKMFNHLFEALAGYELPLVVVGDFMQLAPVPDPEEIAHFAFESDYWKHHMKLNYLTTQHRQKDTYFIDCLNDLRFGQNTERLQKMAKDCTVEVFPTDSTVLASTNRAVDEVNAFRLSLIDGPVHSYEWRVTLNKFNMNERELGKRVRVPATLNVKLGAKVVMLVNHPEGYYQNGSIGTVISVGTSILGKPMVRVELESGTFDIVPILDEVINLQQDVIARVEQFPLRLAYALTIHKSQGMTLDRVCVDLNNHWEPGQTYVAMSRCRTLEGLKLAGLLNVKAPRPECVDICTPKGV